MSKLEIILDQVQCSKIGPNARTFVVQVETSHEGMLRNFGIHLACDYTKSVPKFRISSLKLYGFLETLNASLEVLHRSISRWLCYLIDSTKVCTIFGPSKVIPGNSSRVVIVRTESDGTLMSQYGSKGT